MQAFDGRDVANTGNGKWSKAIQYPQTWRWGKVHRAGNVERHLVYVRKKAVQYSTGYFHGLPADLEKIAITTKLPVLYPPNECNDPLAEFKSNVPVQPTNHLPAW